MRRYFCLTAAYALLALPAWADPPAAALPPGPARRTERREDRQEDRAERREERAANGRVIAPQGADIRAGGVDVNIPPAGSGAAPVVTTPPSQVDLNRTSPAGDAAVQTTVPAPNADQWRYTRHGGRWWYWMPNNSWVIWDGGRWNPHVPNRYTTGYRGNSYSGDVSNDGSRPGFYDRDGYYYERTNRPRLENRTRDRMDNRDRRDMRRPPQAPQTDASGARYNPNPNLAPSGTRTLPSGQAADIGPTNPPDGIRGGDGRTEVPDRGVVPNP